MERLFQRILDDYEQNHNFSGNVLVKKGNELLFTHTCGMAHRGFHVPNRLDTKFDTASVTKVFTAVAVLLLVDEGKIYLNDRITDLIDLNETEIPGDVTVEQLLTHTSGIADDADEEAGENYADLFRNKPNYSIQETADFLPQFAYKKPLFRAGTNMRYNNCAFVLLGMAIEQLSGMDYRQFVMKRIVQPLKLLHTEFCAMDGVNENTAEGYMACRDEEGRLIQWKKNIYSYPPIGSPDGGIYSTVEDLDRLLRAMKSGALLSSKRSAMFFQPHCPFERPFVRLKPELEATITTGYGFEFVMINHKVFCVRKDGMNDGVAAMLSYYPKSDVSLVILCNQDCNIWNMHREIQTVLYDHGQIY
ncbi:beta-lactamase family protein [Sporolactobacillus sp. CPB3-1]|uniref:Beta-lactamase family protein n=1 Tax=Sporolactobacillus mangiferae TaxID=2940498 RepID=A0ABT0MB45_9BACL|nr:serine hydrolase domain-containing protein [Sporolactobacillus mangiferae]MCL1632091.1 beta-lactamase family protein [Sporolactobacillus mangiferae]